MAEFCKDCAKRLGFFEDEKPLLCEGCGEYFEDVSLFDRLIQFIRSLTD